MDRPSRPKRSSSPPLNPTFMTPPMMAMVAGTDPVSRTISST